MGIMERAVVENWQKLETVENKINNNRLENAKALEMLLVSIDQGTYGKRKKMNQKRRRSCRDKMGVCVCVFSVHGSPLIK